MTNAVLNDYFLNELFKDSTRELFARITVLTQDENAIETIEGKVSGGSINVDGKSAIRRTCSLNLVAKDIAINEFYWGIKNKFKLEIGLLNKIDSSYEDIIWFPQGIFLITNFDVNQTLKDCKITIKGKDKMCLLNGEFAGHLPHETDFGKIDIYDNETDTVTTEDVLIKTIIQEAVRNFGGELPQNIIINDIENAGLELLEYRGKTPMYMFRRINDDTYQNVTFNNKQKCYVIQTNGKLKETSIDDSLITYDSLTNLDGEIQPTPVILTLTQKRVNQEQFLNGVYYKLFKQYYINNDNNYFTEADMYLISNEVIYERAYIYDETEQYYEADNEYYIAKFEYGSTPGYKLTDLTYAGDLIAKAGETITSILDKIKKMLGDFEYFYNLDGKFVFQRQQTYNSSNWHINEKDEVLYGDSTLNMEKPIFNLLDNKLITSFKNSPKLTDMKNDYSVWGNRKTNSGADRTIHARYAIDKKPVYYKSFEGKYYVADRKLYDSFLYQVKQDATNEIYEKIYSYTLQYYIPEELQKPERQLDGSWSPGWWDIRDWAEYYKLMLNTTETPAYTMKWYSQNDETGCVPLNTIPGYEDADPEKDVWLIIKNTKNNTYNVQHGSNAYPGKARREVCYYSVLDNSEKGYSTYETNPPQYKEFYAPYNVCTKTHTYLEFLKSDIEKKGNLVYFYNPKFIMGDFDSLTEDLINNRYQEMINNGTLMFVDWREIIYQMAIDYYKHNHEDNFLYELAQNNLDYYPTGVTGYERYYVDLNGFWRDLYNPNPDPQSITISYKEANEAHAEDTLYITNSFRHLFEKEQDQEIINIEDLYILDHSGELEDNNIPSTPEIIPFLGSSYCHLNYNENRTKSDDVYFFENDEGKMNDGIDDIAELNKINLYDIYIKERGPYITLEGYDKNIEAMWEEIDAINSSIVTLTINPIYYTETTVNANNFEQNKYYYFHTDNYKLATEYKAGKKYYIQNNASVSLIASNGIQQGNSISVTMGTQVDCVVSYNGYITKTKQWKVYGNVTKTVILNKENSKLIVQDENDSFANYTDFILYFTNIMSIRDRYYQYDNRGNEDRRPFYVRGEVKPGEEWPEWEDKENNEEDDEENIPVTPPSDSTITLPENTLYTLSGEPILTFDNKVFLITRTPMNTYTSRSRIMRNASIEAESIYKFWVFKYPFGTQLGQYPDDYTNYATLRLEQYLNEYGWDNLYIRNKEPIKFSELDQNIQRLYYKQAQYLTEYLNIVQYDNFNTLKTKLTTISLLLPQIAPSSFSSLEEYEIEIKNICRSYCGEYNQIGKDYVKAIYEVRRKNYDTTEDYNARIYELYEEFLSQLQEQYTEKLNKPSFKTELVRYNKIYYNYNTGKENGDYWAKIISDSPEQLDFWFDFINGETSFLSKYSVQAIGPRSKVVNDTTVKAIYYKEVPNIIFITSKQEYENYDHQTGYTYIQIPSAMSNLFVTSSRGKSAKNALEDLIYKHTYATETATIQTLPIYHLQPNTCLYIRNNETNIDGDYLISKITVPLDQKKMMSITTTKVMPSII